MQWRLGEVRSIVGEPFIYEIEPLWNPEPTSAIATQQAIPTSALVPGKTFRARVRHSDTAGRWSRWSEPVEFSPGEPDLTALRESLVISEIMYAPAPLSPEELAAGYETADLEFIELYNRGTTAIDLTPLRFTKGIDFDFVTLVNPVLAAGQTLVIARNADAFAMRYGMTANGAWGTDKLSNQGELLKLSYGAGLSVIEIEYDDGAPWPAVIRSGSIELRNVTGNNTAAELWRRSALPDGSPNSIPRADPVTQTPIILSVELVGSILRLTTEFHVDAGIPKLHLSRDLVTWSEAESVNTETEELGSTRRHYSEITLEKSDRILYVRAEY
ncbi:MAG: hypothetical protein ACI9R3_001616 [Verrucomicrobiales bacterium]|jgi:hypothetical protein